MVKTGPFSKLEDVEGEVLRLLMSDKKGFTEGLGFREIHRKLSTLHITRRPGSFSTLRNCLDGLLERRLIAQDEDTQKYNYVIPGLYGLEKIILRELIKNSNVFGGGYIWNKGEPVCSQDVFINVKSLEGKSLHGIIPIIHYYESYLSREVREKAKKTQGATESTEELLPVTTILSHRMNLDFLEWWLLKIVEYARERNMIEENSKGSIKDISDEDLDKIWRRLFKDVDAILLTEKIQPQVLLEWLKTPEGRSYLKEINE